MKVESILFLQAVRIFTEAKYPDFYAENYPTTGPVKKRLVHDGSVKIWIKNYQETGKVNKINVTTPKPKKIPKPREVSVTPKRPDTGTGSVIEKITVTPEIKFVLGKLSHELKVKSCTYIPLEPFW